MTATELIFTKITPRQLLFVKTSYTEFYEDPRNALIFGFG